MSEFKNPKPFDRGAAPEPVFDDEPELVELYWRAWEIAWDHVVEVAGLPQTPYMSEGLSRKQIWIWDTCFMVHFCKFAPRTFPGIESFTNFYEVLHDGKASPMRIHHPDNPPLFAWIEYEYLSYTGNLKRLKTILQEKCYLQRHYEFFENSQPGFRPPNTNCAMSAKRVEQGYLWEGCPSGMDNSPRGRDDYSSILWVDAISQQALSALYISRLAQIAGDAATAAEYRAKYAELKGLINRYYWSEGDRFYYDIQRDHPDRHSKVLTIASFWPLLAEAPTAEQVESMRWRLEARSQFGGEMPFPSVAQEDPDFDPLGAYWRGGIWLPTAYMTVRGLVKYGYLDLARKLSYNLVKHMSLTYQTFEPHTIWECYSPTERKPATNKIRELSRTEFCGWSALGPISLFIENVLGFHTVDALKKTVAWDLHNTGRHGIKRFRFGEVETDIIAEGGTVEVDSNGPYTLIINGTAHEIARGKQRIRLG